MYIFIYICMYSLLALAIVLRALAFVLLVFSVATHVHAAVGPVEDTRAVHLVVRPLAFELATILGKKHPTKL